MRETRRATEWHRLLSGRVARAEGSDNEIVIWDNDFDNDDFSFSSRPHRLYPVASLLTNPAGTLRAHSFYLQGGGLFVSGTATLINSNIYSNTATWVRARLCVTFHRPNGC